MPSTIREIVFAEPSGRPETIVLFGGALLFLGGYVLAGVVNGFTVRYELFLGAGFALSGLAESLPTDYRRLAGAFRAIAILVLASVVVAIFLAPGVIVGTQ